MYITIQYILNLSHTLNLNHNGIIPKQYVITRHKSYTHHTILIYTWYTHRLYLWTMQYTQLLNCFQNHFNSSRLKVIQRRVPTVDPIIIPVALKWSYNCVIVQFITHNSIHTISQYTSISQFMTFNWSLTHIFNHNFMISI